LHQTPPGELTALPQTHLGDILLGGRGGERREGERKMRGRGGGEGRKGEKRGAERRRGCLSFA